MKKLILIPFIILIAISTGCDEGKKTRAEGGSTEVSSKILDKFETKAFIDKYNVYIGFGNRFDASVTKSYDRYFGWADIEKGPSSKSKYVRGVLTLSDTEIKNTEKVIDESPEIEEVDDLMKAVVEKAKRLHDILNEADSYYDRQDYKDDDFAKGQTLHKQLLDAFNQYFNSYEKMYVNFKVVQNNLKEFEANKYKENGDVIRYGLMMELNKAEQVLDIIGNNDGENLKNIDLEAFKNKVSEFRKIHEDLEKLSKDEDQKTKEFGEVSVAKSFLPSFIREGNTFIRETRNLQERLEKNDFSYSITHPNIADKGSPLKLNKVYLGLIEAYNRMN